MYYPQNKTNQPSFQKPYDKPMILWKKNIQQTMFWPHVASSSPRSAEGHWFSGSLQRAYARILRLNTKHVVYEYF